ncbi:hypothetical protein C2G38_2281457 [Gigaspora rosea]|uniref:CCHC-type domain-containing protein n=1 Tax=Gigaspora rosea TaxID=44941 RepID=A0A397U8Z8_9GLOM|nr:hypothetical protein C2G38_2281457 [Gigaspora rosea]
MGTEERLMSLVEIVVKVVVEIVKVLMVKQAKQHRYRPHLCYACRKPGHLARSCPSHVQTVDKMEGTDQNWRGKKNHYKKGKKDTNPKGKDQDVRSFRFVDVKNGDVKKNKKVDAMYIDKDKEKNMMINLVNYDEVCGMNEEFKYLPKPDEEMTRDIERCDEVSENGAEVMRETPLAIVTRMETFDDHVEGAKDWLVRFRFENVINEGEDAGVKYDNAKNDEKSNDCLSNTRGTCDNGGNASKITGNTLGTGFSRMQCSIKKQRLKGEIILNNRGGIFRSLYYSSRKLIKKMDVKTIGNSFSSEVYKGFKGDLDRGKLSVDGKMNIRHIRSGDERGIDFYKCLYLNHMIGCDGLEHAIFGSRLTKNRKIGH